MAATAPPLPVGICDAFLSLVEQAVELIAAQALAAFGAGEPAGTGPAGDVADGGVDAAPDLP